MSKFIHLHNHTDFSLLDGAASIPRYVEKAKQFDMDSLAITDHGNMFGVLTFYEACKKAGIKPIIGCEFYTSPKGRTLKDASAKYFHLILLAMDNEGYHNLMELNSISYLEGYWYKPRIDDECLKEHSKGIICLSACLAGELPQLYLQGNPEEAYERAKWYKELFGDRYYIEIQDHNLDDDKKVNPFLEKLSKDLDIPMVATNDIHYIDKEDHNAHDILLCIGTGRKKAEENRMRFETEEFYMKSPEEMEQLFGKYEGAIENTVKIADRCNLEIKFPGPLLPDYDVPPQFTDEADYLRYLVEEGLKKRYGDELGQEHRERAKTELDVIIGMHFEGYFLIVRDYIFWAKQHDIPVGPGRGSGAGSIVAYCIDITNVDPLKYNLLFERFLNPERVSMPDFDIDFCYEGRQTVIDYVTERYGKDRVGQIAAFGTLKAKAVVKDVARVLDIPFDEANLISKLIPDAMPDDSKVSIPNILEKCPEVKEIADRGGVYSELFDVAARLENLHRHISTHAAGVVIGQQALSKYVPLYKDPKTGAVSTQFDKTQIEECGLVKMDFLGLKTLTLIKHTEELIRKRIPDFDITKIRDDDEKTYQMLSSGDSLLVFQFESPGMQKYLTELKPKVFEELNAMVSLYRPGPIQFIPKFIDGKFGRIKIDYYDPDLVELLKPTYGVIVYQEQVMKVGQIIGGFSLGTADILRRNMSKKKVDKVKKMRVDFVEGAVAMGRDRQNAERIFDMLEPFAKYGFNKSHSVCYTVLAYRTAYLKANFFVEFLAANLTNEIGSPDKFAQYLDYAKEKGVTITPPNINESIMYFNVVNQKIVYGLAGIKGVGEPTVELIIKERTENGPYESFMDFLKRSDSKVVNSGVLEGLINSGAFDCFGDNRPTLLNNYEDALKSIKSDKEAKAFGQNMLFGEEDYEDAVFKMVPYDDFDLMEKLENEKNYLGFFVSGHPLDKYREVWKNCVKLDLGRPDRFHADLKATFIGMVTKLRSITTKKGDRMAYITVEDYNGSIEMTIFPKLWGPNEGAIKEGGIFGFKGTFKPYKESLSVNLNQFYVDPNLLKPDKTKRVGIEIVRNELNMTSLKEIRHICGKYRGSSEVELDIYESKDDDGKLDGKKTRILVSPAFFVESKAELKRDLLGCEGVNDIFEE